MPKVAEAKFIEENSRINLVPEIRASSHSNCYRICWFSVFPKERQHSAHSGRLDKWNEFSRISIGNEPKLKRSHWHARLLKLETSSEVFLLALWPAEGGRAPLTTLLPLPCSHDSNYNTYETCLVLKSMWKHSELEFSIIYSCFCRMALTSSSSPSHSTCKQIFPQNSQKRIASAWCMLWHWYAFRFARKFLH